MSGQPIEPFTLTDLAPLAIVAVTFTLARVWRWWTDPYRHLRGKGRR